MKRPGPTFVCLSHTKTVADTLDDAMANGCTKEGGIRDGFLTIKDGETVLYRALQKGTGQPWIVAGYESERIKWGGTETNHSTNPGTGSSVEEGHTGTSP
jgi:hypothetical protein